VADGTGKPLRKANVRIIGDLLVEAKGLVLAPGFIDIHNHSTEGLQNRPLAESQIAQGITTIVLGADGESPWPVAPWLEERWKNLAALNIALLVGHATVRALRMTLGAPFCWPNTAQAYVVRTAVGMQSVRVNRIIRPTS
jgi:N-acyl-D-amino-acid deacylase